MLTYGESIRVVHNRIFNLLASGPTELAPLQEIVTALIVLYLAPKKGVASHVGLWPTSIGVDPIQRIATAMQAKPELTILDAIIDSKFTDAISGDSA